MYNLLKRVMDMAISLVALLLLLPIFVPIMIAIRLESAGSPLFFHKRVGKNCRHFNMVKFRSMVRDAPNIGPYWTSDNDPRITRTGRFLRRTSLDELPQLWNVLVGDMSLVGPRPDTLAQETNYSPVEWQKRHLVAPGITGLAQVNGRSNMTPRRRTQYDIFYATHAGFWLDLDILCKTALTVLRGEGVN